MGHFPQVVCYRDRLPHRCRLAVSAVTRITKGRGDRRGGVVAGHNDRQQVRRAAGQFLIKLGTPARVPQVRGKSPARRVGAVVKKAPHYPVVYKTKTKAAPLV